MNGQEVKTLLVIHHVLLLPFSQIYLLLLPVGVEEGNGGGGGVEGDEGGGQGSSQAPGQKAPPWYHLKTSMQWGIHFYSNELERDKLKHFFTKKNCLSIFCLVYGYCRSLCRKLGRLRVQDLRCNLDFLQVFPRAYPGAYLRHQKEDVKCSPTQFVVI